MSEDLNFQNALKNAVEHLSNNNLKESVQQLNEILKHYPSNIEALNLLFDIFIKI